jgi:hypothetical protein
MNTVSPDTSGAASRSAGPPRSAVQDGLQVALPHPAAGKAKRLPVNSSGVAWKEPTNTLPSPTAGVASIWPAPACPTHRGLQVAVPQPLAAKAYSRPPLSPT